MSDRRQQDTAEREQWEARLQKMERDVVRGNALQRLIAEEQAAKPVQTETQLKGET